jgi:hypothetical protein
MRTTRNVQVLAIGREQLSLATAQRVFFGFAYHEPNPKSGLVRRAASACGKTPRRAPHMEQVWCDPHPAALL